MGRNAVPVRSSDLRPILETDAGAIRGVREGPLAVFRGIPYAEAPVGALRFAPPRPPRRWQGVRDGSRFGPAPPQVADAWMERLSLLGDLATGEDCLTLNAWTPGPDEGRRPVLAWIPGGAFLNGTGAAPLYEARRLAVRGDAVVVTLNYRVGALGFLYLDGAGGLEAANLGLQDQLAGLAFVRAHAARLGGDPERITVFGESAGAGSIAALLAMPRARGAFARAILQSPACEGVIRPEEAARRAAKLLGKLGLTPGTAARLREVPVERLLAAQAECLAEGPYETGMLFAPVVDGEVLPEIPVAALRRGLAREVAFVIGTTVDELLLYGADEPPGIPDAARGPMLASQLRVAPARREAAARRLLEGYRAARASRGESTAAREVFYAILSDRYLRVPAARLAEAAARHRPDTWMYLFAWRSPLRGGAHGACHALDLPFTFGNLDLPGIAEFAGGGPAAERLAHDWMDAWLAFARAGDPSHPGIGAWPRYTKESRTTMVFGDKSGAVDAPLEAERALWDELEGEGP
jgi:para-nitrobenzyl esterase